MMTSHNDSMHHTGFQRLAAFCLLAACIAVPVLGQTPQPSPADELEAFIREAEDNSPDILESRYQVEQTLIKHQELLEYLDPAIFGKLGHANHAKYVPGASSDYTSPTNNASELQAGVEIPFEQGFYFTVGATERVNYTTSDDVHTNNTIIGTRIHIPLLRNRGFAELSNSRALAKAEYNTAVATLLNQMQLIRKNVTLAYIAAYESQMSYKVTIEASERFRRLVDEATQLEHQGVIPAYQIHDATMDYQIGLENEEIARNQVELNLIALATVLGKHREIRLKHENDTEYLVNCAEEATPATQVDMERAFNARGSYIAVENTIEQARVKIRTAEEEMRDDVTLSFGAAWQGDSHNRIIRNDELSGVEREGIEVALVWKRTLDYRGPKARIARYNALVQQYKQQLRAQAVAIEADIRNALNNLAAARNRLGIVNKGIEAASKTLEAEMERFKLGQTTSSAVTDAQKDLTSLMQRRTSAAADLLRGYANLQYATGYTVK